MNLNELDFYPIKSAELKAFDGFYLTVFQGISGVWERGKKLHGLARTLKTKNIPRTRKRRQVRISVNEILAGYIRPIMWAIKRRWTG